MHPHVRFSRRHVRAVFAGSVAFFELPLNVTFEDLSERISRLGEHHAGGLISIDVRKSGEASWAPWRQSETNMTSR